ncbi:PE-PPE domain-containing protein [Mycolicibacterium madagascariense]|uniref:PE-PPE domain-containing protein n=1 Tax=Mycolicibacterium madagascariense TaxID=212765 RepID=UPI0013D47732|nr:PE-PPE domain-containing protein [Mycolicibacterium madagascariense]MCV7012376.1 PE-PPE domain-containing protein [Mycolicibacterium madagascariense]
MHPVVAIAETRIGINGGRPSTWPFLQGALAGQGLTQQGWLDFGARVGENWLPGTTGVALDYPAQLGPISGPGALSGDASTDIGAQKLDAMIKDLYVKGQPLAVAGLSEGTLVIDQELVALQNDPNAPAPADLTFYVFGDMARGLGHMYFSGMTVPFFGKTFGPLPDSQYDTVVVNEQWDGWANPPDRPWNLLADVNAAMGAVYTYKGSNDHSQSSLDSMADAVLVSQTTSSRGGVTSTYIVPRKQLPITKPLLQLGVPQATVDQIDDLLRPLIATGYSSMTPHLGPYVDAGKLVWTPPKPKTLPAKTSDAATVSAVQASAVKSEAVKSAAAKSDTAKSDGTKPTAAAKPVAKVDAAKPSTKDDAAKPTTKDDDAAKPSTKDDAAKPSTKDDAAKPSTKDDDAAKPAKKRQTTHVKAADGADSSAQSGADQDTAKPAKKPKAKKAAKESKAAASAAA